MSATVMVSPRGAERIESGHPWIYRTDLVDGSALGGDRVLVRGPRGRALGSALYSDRSQIALRMLTDADAVADDALIEAPAPGGAGVPREARASTHRRIDWFTAKPICCRR